MIVRKYCKLPAAGVEGGAAAAAAAEAMVGRSFNFIDDFFAQELAAAVAALGAGGRAHSITVNGKARDLIFTPKICRQKCSSI